MTTTRRNKTSSAKRSPEPSGHSVADLPYMELPHHASGVKLGRPPLTEGFQHPVGAEIRRAHLAFKNLLHQKLRARKVTSAQWVFLRILWNEDGLNQKDLAQRVGVHPTTAVPAITILERNGYVRRERSSQDKRNVFVYLTDAGKLLAHELVPFAVEMNQKSLRGMAPEEADMLIALLLKVQRNLEDD